MRCSTRCTALADAHPAEPPLREQWAKAANNYVFNRAAAEPEACRALLDALRSLADAHPAEPPLREWWVRCSDAYVITWRTQAPDETLWLLDATAAVVEAHPGEDPLFYWHAMGAVAWLQVNVANEPGCGGAGLAAPPSSRGRPRGGVARGSRTLRD